MGGLSDTTVEANSQPVNLCFDEKDSSRGLVVRLGPEHRCPSRAARSFHFPSGRGFFFQLSYVCLCGCVGSGTPLVRMACSYRLGFRVLDFRVQGFDPSVSSRVQLSRCEGQQLLLDDVLAAWRSSDDQGLMQASENRPMLSTDQPGNHSACLRMCGVKSATHRPRGTFQCLTYSHCIFGPFPV